MKNILKSILFPLDGVNEVKAMMQLSVRLITEEMLFNSITVRLNDMTAEQFLSPLLGFFIDGLAAIIPCPKENIYVFSVQVRIYTLMVVFYNLIIDLIFICFYE